MFGAHGSFLRIFGALIALFTHLSAPVVIFTLLYLRMFGTPAVIFTLLYLRMFGTPVVIFILLMSNELWYACCNICTAYIRMFGSPLVIFTLFSCRRFSVMVPRYLTLLLRVELTLDR